MQIKYIDADGITHDLDVTDEVGSFYLNSIGREQLDDRRHRDHRAAISKPEEWDYYCHVPDSADELAFSDELRQALDKLTERRRYIFTKVHIEGYTVAEIAAAEGKSKYTIHHILSSAVSDLKNILKNI
jgi:RNA polymerase sigma factor (sigma-70 family)